LRSDAAESLGHLGPKAKSAVPALILALKDRSGTPTVSWHAMRALRKIGKQAHAAIPHLIRLIHDNTRPDSEKQTALMALGEIDTKAKYSLPTLRMALKGNNTLIIGAALAAKDMGRSAAALEPDLKAALLKATAVGAPFVRSALLAIRE
jgi:hypothetical protein